MALVGDGFEEHGAGADPEAMAAVEGFVNDEEFKGFGVAGEAEDLVVEALVVAVETGAGIFGERG